MERKETELTRMNKLVIACWTVTVSIISAAYLLEVLKGERTAVYYLMLLLCGWVPLAFGWINYKRNPETTLQKVLAVYGYAILYAYVLLTGDTVLTYVYIFPMLSALLVYSDVKLLRNLAVLSTIINVIYIGISVGLRHATSADDIADYEIQFFSVVLIMMISYFACRILGDINQHRMEIIERQGESQKAVLQQVLDAAGVLSDKVGRVDEQAKGIESQSESAQASIEEIATGTADVANNIQEQLSMSNGISDELEHLTEVSREIQQKFNETHNMSQSGIESMGNLSQSASLVAQSKEQVSEATESLVGALQEAKEILSLIRNITSQTNLLALNASIEAARAGEQGKGFAVVAGEIQKLSGDTGEATDKISDILETLADEAGRVNDAVENLDDLSNQQNELIAQTDEQFRAIDGNIAEMTEGVQRQTDFLTHINDNNTKIAGSISNTSAYTQQLTASSENTMYLTKESLEGTRAMTGFLNEILAEVQSLQAMNHSEEA